MPRRTDLIITCPGCGRQLERGQGQECLSCLKLFHRGCLVKVRLKKGGKGGRLSYRICKKCLAENPDNRIVTREP